MIPTIRKSICLDGNSSGDRCDVKKNIVNFSNSCPSMAVSNLMYIFCLDFNSCKKPKPLEPQPFLGVLLLPKVVLFVFELNKYFAFSFLFRGFQICSDFRQELITIPRCFQFADTGNAFEFCQVPRLFSSHILQSGVGENHICR